MTVSAMAAETAYVGIKLTGKTTATSTNYKIRITEDSQYANGYVDGEEAEILNFTPSNSNSVFLYALVGTHKCSSIYETTISNMPMGFQTNRVDNEYTLTFTSAEGRSLKILDKVTNSIIEIEADGTYDFVVNAENCPGFVLGQNKLIEDRFVIEPVLFYTRDITAGQWGTICYPKSITAVQGGVLYNLTSKTETQVYGEEAELPTVAGKPYVFKANADATQLVMPYTGEEVDFAEDATGLVGKFEDTYIPTTGTYYGIINNYIVEIAGGILMKANRAYIILNDIPEHQAGAPGRAIFMIQNATTGLEGATVNGLQNGTYMVNGQLVIVKDGKTFNVLGL